MLLLLSTIMFNAIHLSKNKLHTKNKVLYYQNIRHQKSPNFCMSTNNSKDILLLTRKNVVWQTSKWYHKRFRNRRGKALTSAPLNFRSDTNVYATQPSDTKP